MTRCHAFVARATAVLALALAAGCTRKKTPDAAPTAARIVSLSPSTTETLFAIGAGGAQVGRSRYCDYPAEVLPLPQVGGYVDPSFEAILALRPDLVVGGRGPAGPKLAERLAAQGVGTFFPETETVAQIEEMIRDLGRRTGHDDGAAATVAKIRARITDVERAVDTRPRPRVLLVYGFEPISAAGPHSFPDEMITRAGGVNVVTDGGPYPILGIERVLALDPDVILNSAMGESRAAERITKEAPGWKETRAVKAGRVVPITDESVLRPGPRVGDGVAVIARAIHPGLALP